MTAEARQQRIFFALWPDAGTRARLAAIAAQIPLERPARRVPEYNLHLTLHFVGSVDQSVVECMRRRARAVECDRFAVALDRGGHFAGAGVGWLGCSAVPDALHRLHRRLGRELSRCDYAPETRAYRPHVTVARKLVGAPPPIAFAALHWKVDNFVLLESRSDDRGVKYHVIETYPLA